MEKIILGTVQFGLDYGITNSNGQIKDSELDKIFEFCNNNKLYIYDTAQGYGTSEDIVAKYKKKYKNFKIITKSKFKDNMNSIDEIIKISINKFDKIDYFLLHSFEDYNKDVIDILLLHKLNNNIEKIGVSIYTVSEAKILLRDKNIDIIQLPLNYLDNQWNDLEFINLLKERKDIEIHARSIFLQGILLNPIVKKPINIDEKDFDYLNNKINDICNKLNLSKIELCFGYINSCTWIDKYLIGIDNYNHLLLNHQIINKNIKLNQSQLDYISNNINDINPLILNPAKWKFI